MSSEAKKGISWRDCDAPLVVVRQLWRTIPRLLIISVVCSMIEGMLVPSGAIVVQILINFLLSGNFAAFKAAAIGPFLFVMLAGALASKLSNSIENLEGETYFQKSYLKAILKTTQMSVERRGEVEVNSMIQTLNTDLLNSCTNSVKRLGPLCSGIMAFILLLWLVMPKVPVYLVATVLLVTIPSFFLDLRFGWGRFITMRIGSPDRRLASSIYKLLAQLSFSEEVFHQRNASVLELIKVCESTRAKFNQILINFASQSFIWGGVIAAVTSLVTVGVYYVLGEFYIVHQLRSIGEFLKFTAALAALGSMFSRVLSAWSNLMNLVRPLKFIERLLSIPVAENNSGGTPFPKETVSITVNGLTYAYPSKDRNVLHDVSIVIPAGAKVALVGENGGGKSTFTKCLYALQTPEGRILFDHVPKENFDQTSLQSSIALVQQNPCLYPLRVVDIIARSRMTDPNMARVEQACTLTGFDKVVERLAGGFESVVDPSVGGTALSGGESQLLNMTRVVYEVLSGASLVIADEATSAMDPNAANRVLQLLFNKKKVRATVLFVCHTMSLASQADLILFFKEGKLIEKGNHAVLLKQRGEYYRFFVEQATKYIESASLPIFIGVIEMQFRHFLRRLGK